MAKFNQDEFIKTNLLKSLKSGAFDSGQINIFAINYLLKGAITQTTFDEISAAVTEYEAEQKRLAEEQAEQARLAEEQAAQAAQQEEEQAAQQEENGE